MSDEAALPEDAGLLENAALPEDAGSPVSAALPKTVGVTVGGPVPAQGPRSEAETPVPPAPAPTATPPSDGPAESATAAPALDGTGESATAAAALDGTGRSVAVAPARPRERWAWPAVAVVAALAGLGYGWASAHTSIEIYYAAAVRTMAHSWGAFWFGGFDPTGTVTLDKLPGSFWVQALVVRVFGLSTWTLIAPQVAAGVATVVVLFVTVRRVAGARAGLVAAVIAAATPAAAVMARGNTADGLCVLLMVLAADATMRAVRTGRTRPLVIAAILVGLGFQAKMLEAWAILPALGAAYLLAAPVRARARFGRLAVAGVVTVAVSLAWMTVVSLTPASQRPYVDGTAHNSVFEQVFVYNGVARFSHGTAFGLPRPSYRPSEHAIEYYREVSEQLRPTADDSTPGVARLVTGPIGRDAGWLLLVAVVALGAVIFSRRGRPRTDAVRAAAVLWGGWLIAFAVLDSAGTQLLSYYLGVFAPPIAALCALGLRAAYRSARRSADRPVPTAAGLSAEAEALSTNAGLSAAAETPPVTAAGPSAAEEALPGRAGPTAGLAGAASAPDGVSGAGRPPRAGRVAVKVLPVLAVGACTAVVLVRGTPAWFAAATLGAVLIGLAVAVAALAATGVAARRRAAALVAAFATLLVGPAAATVALVAAGGGSFDAPYTVAGTLAHSTARITVRGYGGVVSPSMTNEIWSELRALPGIYSTRLGPDRLFLVFTSAEAAHLVLGGVPGVVPIGGYSGLVDAPTLNQLGDDLRAGKIMYAVVPGAGDPRAGDPRVHLIEARCRPALADHDSQTAAAQLYLCGG